MGNSETARILRLAGQSHGVVTRADLARLGVSGRRIASLVTGGVLTPHGRRVFVVEGQEDNLLLRSVILGKRLPDAILSGPSAAVLGSGPWRGTDLGTTPFAVHGPRSYVRATLVQHPGISYRVENGLRIAHARFVVVDLMRVLDIADAHTVMDRALQQGLVSLDWLTRRSQALKAHLGNAQVRQLIELGAAETRFPSEHRMLELLRDSGPEEWQPNHRVQLEGSVFVLDFALTEARLFIEIDGKAYHIEDEAFQNDRSRQNALVLAGWTPLRFTWQDLVDRPAHVIDSVRRAVESKRAA